MPDNADYVKLAPMRFRDSEGNVDEVTGLIVGVTIGTVVIVAVVLLLLTTA
jgi:hypothetical protein